MSLFPSDSISRLSYCVPSIQAGPRTPRGLGVRRQFAISHWGRCAWDAEVSCPVIPPGDWLLASDVSVLLVRRTVYYLHEVAQEMFVALFTCPDPTRSWLSRIAALMASLGSAGAWEQLGHPDLAGHPGSSIHPSSRKGSGQVGHLDVAGASWFIRPSTRKGSGHVGRAGVSRLSVEVLVPSELAALVLCSPPDLTHGWWNGHRTDMPKAPFYVCWEL